jgi:hypothetical protein
VLEAVCGKIALPHTALVSISALIAVSIVIDP